MESKNSFDRCVIIGAAEINNYERARKSLRQGDYYIFCDAGLKHQHSLGVKPDLIIGDFDSFKRPDSQEIEIITLPRAKDDTDSFYAVKEGLRRGFNDFLFLGVFGQRLDHTFVNVSALLYLYDKGIHSLAVDDYSVMSIVGKEQVAIEDGCAYFSLVPLTGSAGGINISGAKFPLKDGAVYPNYIYTTSNEVLPGEKAKVQVQDGLMLLIEGR